MTHEFMANACATIAFCRCANERLSESLSVIASLVQLNTCFICEGPAFVRKTMTRLHQKMRQAGLGDLREIVGAEAGSGQPR
jgi:dihydroorotate dehydrogenase